VSTKKETISCGDLGIRPPILLGRKENAREAAAIVDFNPLSKMLHIMWDTAKKPEELKTIAEKIYGEKPDESILLHLNSDKVGIQLNTSKVVNLDDSLSKIREMALATVIEEASLPDDFSAKLKIHIISLK
jgi:hypothetical protein